MNSIIINKESLKVIFDALNQADKDTYMPIIEYVYETFADQFHGIIYDNNYFSS